MIVILTITDEKGYTVTATNRSTTYMFTATFLI